MAKINRSSKTGKFVTKKYASKHKTTTETEAIKKKKAPTCEQIISALEKYRQQLYDEPKIGSREFGHKQTAIHWCKQIVRDHFGVEREKGAMAWVK